MENSAKAFIIKQIIGININKLVKEWCDFCTGKVNYDKSHFSYLFHEDNIDNYLTLILHFFPNSNELESKVKNILNIKKNNKIQAIDIDKESLSELVYNFFNEQALLLDDLEENIRSSLHSTITLTIDEDIMKFDDQDIAL